MDNRYLLPTILAIFILGVAAWYVTSRKGDEIITDSETISDGQATEYRGKGGDYSFMNQPGWYLHEEKPEYVFFTREPNEDGMGHDTTELGPRFTVSVSKLGDLRNSKTKEEWLAASGLHSGNPLFKGIETVQRNGREMRRAVLETSGVGGEILMYVLFADDGRVIVLTHAPYKTESDETKSFEKIVQTFKLENGIAITNVFDDKIVYTLDMSQDIDKYRADCQARGGEFNQCGSPCPSDGGVCIQVCALTCELGGK